MIKHATASTFVFCRAAATWRIGLIEHPLHARLMIPGGHVELDETAPEAALREVAEETGLEVQFVVAPATAVPAEVRDLDRLVSLPWWILQQPIDADNHVSEPHIHVDHLYIAVADSPDPVTAPAHPFGWYEADELAGLRMYPDTRALAWQIFPEIEALTLAFQPGQ